jgi:carbonic anhydrase
MLTILLAVSLIVPVLASPESVSVLPEVAQKMLIDGNSRFISEKYAPRDLGQTRRSELEKGQHPFAVIISCSDSRVPPELIFDQGLGNLFVVRVAGNVLDSIELGSIEYAVEHLGAKLIVVLGHEKCGAVKATVDGGDLPPNIKAIADKIQPAVVAAKAANSKDIYETATDGNIENMVSVIKTDSIIQHIGNVKVVGAKYHIDSGVVEYLQSEQ